MWLAKDLQIYTQVCFPPLAASVDVTSAEWMSVDKFKTAVLKQAASSTALASEQADTRAEHMINEVLIIFPGASHRPREFTGRDAGQTTVVEPSSILTHGKCSLNISYLSTWNAFIGKEMEGGWIVKCHGLTVPASTEEYYLLSQSEGFNFRNKLMKKSEVEEWFSNHHK
jgi:hypothetical protein